MINSALVSAQNRVRLYWTNIPNITQPKDKGIVLKDVLEDEFESDRNKSYCIDANYYKGANWEQYKSKARRQLVTKPIQVGIATDIKGYDCIKRVYSDEGKSPTLTTMEGGHRQPKVACGAFRGRYEEDGSTKQQLEVRKDDKTNTLTSVQKDNVIVYDNEQPHKENYIKLRDESKEKVLATQMDNSKNFGNAVREKKAFTLRASKPNGVINKEQYYYRKLTPLECERLQTVPDGYTEGVSNTQRYKMLGNGWTIEVIKHVLQNIT
jgi:site-specific DNA-cytosine methylase